MKQVKFKQDGWVLKNTRGGFAGIDQWEAARVYFDDWFTIDSIVNYGDFSDILVWSQNSRGVMDGEDVFLRNVPNSLFETREVKVFNG